MSLPEPLTDADRYDAAIETGADLLKENFELKRQVRLLQAGLDKSLEALREVEQARDEAREAGREMLPWVGSTDSWGSNPEREALIEKYPFLRSSETSSTLSVLVR